MASWKEIVVDYIRAKLATGKVMFGTKARYEQPYALIDFADDDLINKRALSGFSLPPIPIEANITANVTTIPQIIPHTDMIWPTVIFRTSSGDEYGGAHSNDDGTNITITGDDDGTGKFADTFVVVIKA